LGQQAKEMSERTLHPSKRGTKQKTTFFNREGKSKRKKGGRSYSEALFSEPEHEWVPLGKRRVSKKRRQEVQGGEAELTAGRISRRGNMEKLAN